MKNDNQKQSIPLFKQIDLDKIIKRYKKSFSVQEQYQVQFPDLDKIVDGTPLKTTKGAPYVADTSLISLVRRVGRRSLQQMPIFSAVINGAKHSDGTIIANFFLRQYIFPQQVFGRDVLATLQIGTQQSLTRGYSAFMPEISSLYGEPNVKMRLLHYRDVANEPGITHDSDSSYWFVKAERTRESLERMIKKLEEKGGSDIWDIKALKELLKEDPAGRTDNQQQIGTTKPVQADDVYVLITYYSVGAKEPVITFCEQLPDRPLRAYRNNSKFDFSPIMYLVLDNHPETPYGQSRVALASGVVAMATAHKQASYVSALINAAPPIEVVGQYQTPIQLTQGAVWRTNDPNAKVNIKNIDNGSLDRYVSLQSQFNAEIQSIMGTPMGTSSAGENTFGYSKTSTGVKMAQSENEISNNATTNALENFLRQYATVALDRLWSEMSGADTLIVDDKCRDELNAVAGYERVGTNNEIEWDWDKSYEGIKRLEVDIELSMTPDEMEEKKRKDLQDMATVFGQNIDKIPDGQEKFAKITDALIDEAIPEIKSRANRSEYVPQTTQTEKTMV